MKVQNRAQSVAGRVGAVALMLAAVQYVALEAVAASAWHHPAYNYAVDFISDLGNPVPGDVFDGRLIDSPLNVVMDTAFIAQGALFIVGAALLYRTIPGKVRNLALVLAVLHGAGVILVGFFHESAAALTNGVIVVHSIGAASTIVCGNVLAITVGLLARRLDSPHWLRNVSITLGVVGLIAFVVLMADKPLYYAAGGVPERIAVYTIVAWEAIIGLTLVVSRVRSPQRQELVVSA